MEQEENGYLSEQFISGRRPSPLDSRRSDMTDQDKWSGSEVRSIQSSDCPRQEQRGQTVNKAQLPPILTQRQFGLWVAQGEGEKKIKINKVGTADAANCRSEMGLIARWLVCLGCRMAANASSHSPCWISLARPRSLSLMDYLTFYCSRVSGSELSHIHPSPGKFTPRAPISL